MQTYFTRVVLTISALFFMFDILADIKEGESVAHWIGESLVFCIICASLFLEMNISRKLTSKVNSYEIELDALKGNLAEVVKKQFKDWQLSKSEDEVAWLIIKGFSFAEISTIRDVSERTVRQQAGAIYKKSGNKNRSEFTASFLDDLLNQPNNDVYDKPKESV